VFRRLLAAPISRLAWLIRIQMQLLRADDLHFHQNLPPRLQHLLLCVYHHSTTPACMLTSYCISALCSGSVLQRSVLVSRRDVPLSCSVSEGLPTAFAATLLSRCLHLYFSHAVCSHTSLTLFSSAVHIARSGGSCDF
jgi:hypothetical protein